MRASSSWARRGERGVGGVKRRGAKARTRGIRSTVRRLEGAPAYPMRWLRLLSLERLATFHPLAFFRCTRHGKRVLREMVLQGC